MLNQTFVKTCTYATCSVEEYGQMNYVPTLAGNALFLGLFGLALLCQCLLGIRYRTWGYLFGMFGGLVLEILGYIGRVQLHYNVFSQNKFVNYVIGTSIGPAFFSASIYLCLARIISVFGTDLSPLKPRTITCVFIFCDFISILLQSLGGSITASADTWDNHQLGIHIMIAGLASQVASMTVYVSLCLRFAWNVWKDPSKRNPNSEDLRESLKFRAFLYALATATVAILIRTCFRLAELHDGYGGRLANDEVLYMILEPVMITIAVSALTIGHPGPILGTVWKANGFEFRKRKMSSLTGEEKRGSGDHSPA